MLKCWLVVACLCLKSKADVYEFAKYQTYVSLLYWRVLKLGYKEEMKIEEELASETERICFSHTIPAHKKGVRHRINPSKSCYFWARTLSCVPITHQMQQAEPSCRWLVSVWRAAAAQDMTELQIYSCKQLLSLQTKSHQTSTKM